MLILTSEQVEYCDILCQVSGQIKKLPGVTYHGRCFVRGESYSKNQLELALSHTRRLLSDPSGMLVALIESSTDFTLCYWDNQVKPVKVNSNTDTDAQREDSLDPSQLNRKFHGTSYDPVRSSRKLATAARSLIDNQSIRKFRGASYSKPLIPRSGSKNTAKRKLKSLSY